ncbi:MAG: hypothetical protein GXO47_06155, partial [Chlorobi bacterium]|nr:hypothetical protein [Chlorobiota bacterium]
MSQDIVFFDGEDGTIGDWAMWDNEPSGATIENVSDGGSLVMKFTDTGDQENSAKLGGSWNNSSSTTLSFRLKATGDFQLYVI